MGAFYLLALLPAVAWGLSFYYDKRIAWWEALAGCAAGFAVAGIIHLLVGFMMPMDKQTVSGQVYSLRRMPPWTEYYEYAVYRTETRTRTVSDGKNSRTETYTVEVFDHWEPTSEFHPEQWYATTTFGEWIIDEQRHANIHAMFKAPEMPIAGCRTNWGHHASRLLSGDPNDYTVDDASHYVYPVADTWTFENRIILAPTIYQFEQVPAGIRVYPWPEVHDRFTSERLLGTASSTFGITAWDQLNACLGPSVKVNLIAIGFPSDSTISLGHWQEAAWKGGKKNDLVICWGGGTPTVPGWAYVFGWTDKNLVKRNLETLILRGDLSNKTLPAISDEVAAHYKLKDFEHDFAYIHIDPPRWSWVALIAAMIATQGAAHYLFRVNEQGQGTGDGRRQVFGSAACPACGNDPFAHPNADGSWTHGTELACTRCGFKGLVSCEEDGYWLNWKSDQPVKTLQRRPMRRAYHG